MSYAEFHRASVAMGTPMRPSWPMPACALRKLRSLVFLSEFCSSLAFFSWLFTVSCRSTSPMTRLPACGPQPGWQPPNCAVCNLRTLIIFFSLSVIMPLILTPRFSSMARKGASFSNVVSAFCVSVPNRMLPRKCGSGVSAHTCDTH